MGRLAIVLFVSFLLTACAAGPAPLGASQQEPRLAGGLFVTSDGLTLPLRSWLPESEVKAAVVALHGFNDYSAAFDVVPDAPGVGPFLSERGIAVYAYDQRGFGAGPQAGRWAGGDVMANDLSDMIALVRATHPDVPVHVIGVSMGGAVTLKALTANDALGVTSVVLVAPAVWGRVTMPWYQRFALWLGETFTPGMTPSGRGLGRRASDNLEMLRKNGQDPLFIKETRVDTISGLTDLMSQALEATAEVKTPALYLYGANDQIIPPGATNQAINGFASDAPVRYAFYPNGWHMLLRDLQAEKVLKDVASYVLSSDANLPSGAETGARAAIAALP